MIENITVIVLFFLMLILGANINYDNLLNLNKYKKTFAIASVGQLIILPFLAFVLIYLTSPPNEIAAVFLLVSICPSGIASIVYSSFALGNLALSIALTGINALCMFILLPVLIMTFIPFWVDVSIDLIDLITLHALNFLILLALPMILGMLLREIKPLLLMKILPAAELVGKISIVLLILFILYDLEHESVEQLSVMVLLSLSFTVTAVLIAYGIARYLQLSIKDEAALLLELPIKNFVLTTLIAYGIFDKPEFFVFIAIFFVSQFPIICLLIFWYRKKISLHIRAKLSFGT